MRTLIPTVGFEFLILALFNNNYCYTVLTWRWLRCGSKVITNDKVNEKRKLAINTFTYYQTWREIKPYKTKKLILYSVVR